MSAEFYITDGTTLVSLINGPIYLEEWLPSIPDYKGGGVYADSPIGESRFLVYKQLESITDTMSIKIANLTQDSTIATLQKLQNLLESAANYWTNPYATVPVYLVAKASKESNARYATIIRGRIPQLGPIFAQPFTNCPPVLDNISLSIEHNLWQSAAPGDTGTSSALTPGSLSAGTMPDHQVLAQPYMESLETKTVNPPQWAEYGGPHATFELSSDQVYQGDYSLHLSVNATTKGTRQDNNLSFTTAGATYTATCWVYVVSGTVKLGISDDDGAFSNATESSSTTTGEWEQLTVSGTPSTTGLWVYVLSDGAAAEWYMDNAEMFISSGMSSAIVIPSQTELFVSNSRREQRLDVIYVYNNGSWSGNLLYESSPQDITGINDNEACYFGIWASTEASPDVTAHGGPFDNIVFNISRAVGGTAPTFVWEYSWVGGNFSTLPYYVDRTDTFSNTGVQTFTLRPWAQWEALQLSGAITAGEGSATAPDDECYWIRCRKTGGTMSNGEQAQISTPFPYTVTWPYVEIAENTIGGNAEAKAKIDVKNYGGEAKTTTTVQVAESGDDTYFDDAVGTNQDTDTVIKMGTQYYAGCRFQTVAIAPGSQIISARIEFKRANTNGSDITRMMIRGHDVSSSALLLSSYSYAAWQALPQTTAEVSWQMELTQPAGTAITTPNFASVIQEITDRSDWGSGGDITIFFDDDSSDGTSEYQFASQDNVTYEEPILTVIFQDNDGGVWLNRTIAGVRSTSRGADFVSRINFSDWQLQKGITIEPTSNAYWTSNIRGAGARVIGISGGYSLPWPPTTTTTSQDFNISISIDAATAPSFVGTFRTFIRVSSDLAAGQTADFAVAIRTGSSGVIKYGNTSAEFRTIQGRAWPSEGNPANDILVLDLGLINIPSSVASGYDKLEILVAGASDTAGITLYCYDLVLMPSDEWIGEIATRRTIDSAVIGLDSMHFDSITRTRNPIYAYHTDSNDNVKAILSAYSQTLKLSPTQAQRIYFLFNTLERDAPQFEGDERSSPWAFTGVSVQTLRKYLSMRGDS